MIRYAEFGYVSICSLFMIILLSIYTFKAVNLMSKIAQYDGHTLMTQFSNETFNLIVPFVLIVLSYSGWIYISVLMIYDGIPNSKAVVVFLIADALPYAQLLWMHHSNFSESD